MNRESARRNFRPARIRVLFVGESPPANGGFFYLGSPMTSYMAQVFAQVRGKEFHAYNEFLQFFKDEGCYLDDLSHTPVDNLPASERQHVLANCVGALAKRMKEYKPEHVVAVLKAIEIPVRQAALIANLQLPVYAVPFPGHGNQRRFVTELSGILKTIWDKS